MENISRFNRVYILLKFVKPSKISMKIITALSLIFLNVLIAESFNMSHSTFKDALLDRAIMLELTHNHPNIFKKHKTSRISKILKFQMKKILELHNTHLNQGNMNRPHRAKFQKNLKIKFNNIRKYSMMRLRKDHEVKHRQRSRNPSKRRG